MVEVSLPVMVDYRPDKAHESRCGVEHIPGRRQRQRSPQGSRKTGSSSGIGLCCPGGLISQRGSGRRPDQADCASALIDDDLKWLRCYSFRPSGTKRVRPSGSKAVWTCLSRLDVGLVAGG